MKVPILLWTALTDSLKISSKKDNFSVGIYKEVLISEKNEDKVCLKTRALGKKCRLVFHKYKICMNSGNL